MVKEKIKLKDKYKIWKYKRILYKNIKKAFKKEKKKLKEKYYGM